MSRDRRRSGLRVALLGRQQGDADLADSPAVDLFGGEPPPAVLDGLPRRRDVFERAEQEAAEGVPLLVGEVELRAPR